MKKKMVWVEWEDAAFASGYYDKNKPKEYEPVLTKSVGFVIKNTPKTIVISHDRFYYEGKLDDERHITIIPKRMVKRIHELHKK